VPNAHSDAPSLGRNRKLKTERQIVLARRAAPRACGVYFLIKGERIVYVGQSVNVLARVGSHAGADKDFDGWNYVRCLPEELDALERHYIDTYRPILNRDRVTLSAPISFKLLAREIVETAAPAVKRTQRLRQLGCDDPWRGAKCPRKLIAPLAPNVEIA
jgi:hypothetical protein